MHRFNTKPRRFRGHVSDRAPIVFLCINLVRHTDDIYWSAEGSIRLTAKGPRMDGWFLLPSWRTAPYLLASGKMEIKNHRRLRIFSWNIQIRKCLSVRKIRNQPKPNGSTSLWWLWCPLLFLLLFLRCGPPLLFTPLWLWGS